MPELHELTIATARDLLANGEITALELTQACLDRIAAVDNQVRAFLAIDATRALEQARLADERRTTTWPAGNTARHQRCDLDQGADDHLWIEDAGALRSTLRRDGGAAAERAGGGAAGQAQLR